MWLSPTTEPSPGKCLTTGMTPTSRYPFIVATTIGAAARTSVEYARLPVSDTPVGSTSATGAITIVTPTCLRAVPLSRATCRAYDGSPVAPTVAADGTGSTPTWSRWTAPPSWSMETSSGSSSGWSPTSCSCEVRVATWSASAMTSGRRNTPPNP